MYLKTTSGKNRLRTGNNGCLQGGNTISRTLFTAYPFVCFDFEIGESTLLKSFYFLYKCNTLITEKFKNMENNREENQIIYKSYYSEIATVDFLMYFSSISFFYIYFFI